MGEPKTNDGKLTRTVQILREMHFVADLLADGYLPRQAARVLVKDRGYTRTQANRYVAATLRLLVQDQQMEPLESKRARAIASAQKIHREALTAKKHWQDSRTGEVREYDAPDRKAALAAIELIGKLEGIL